MVYQVGGTILCMIYEYGIQYQLMTEVMYLTLFNIKTNAIKEVSANILLIVYLILSRIYFLWQANNFCNTSIPAIEDSKGVLQFDETLQNMNMICVS